MSARQHQLATVAAIVVGLMVAAQSRINGDLAAELAESAGSTTAAGIQAALLSFATGLVLLAAVAVVLPRMRRGLAGLAAAVRQRKLLPWQLLGGLGGAWLVTTQGLTVPTLGVALFIVAVVAGQTAASLGVDAAGLGPAGRMPVTGRRVLAAALALLAVAVTALPRIDADAGAAAGFLALLVISAGAGIAVQQALNGRVAVAARYPPAAAVVNFVIGTAALMVVTLAGLLAFGWGVGELPDQPVLYLSGPLGVAFIAIAAWAVPVVGVLAFGLASISGQLVGGAVLDLLLPQPGVTVGPGLVIGIALTVLAVLVGNRR